ncbi:MAG: HAD family hydrolase [Selenomonadaceae bacterium]|nr:HAD family hydrolase [Selenomonadaceae bacterium]
MKAVFFDIDGTLIAMNKGIPDINPPVIETLKNLQRAGHKIFIATGRPFGFLDAKFTNLNFDGYVTCNGAAVLFEGKLIVSRPIDPKIVLESVKKLQSHNIDFVLESCPEIYFSKSASIMEDFLFNRVGIPQNQNVIRKFDLERIARDRVYKIEAISNNPEDEKIYIDMIENTPGMTGVLDPFHHRNLEFYSAAVTKGSGILAVLKHLGIEVSESYAFGDGLNDLEMMQTAGHAFVMGNAVDELKPFAEKILPSVFDDGVAFGINEYILKEDSK